MATKTGTPRRAWRRGLSPGRRAACRAARGGRSAGRGPPPAPARGVIPVRSPRHTAQRDWNSAARRAHAAQKRCRHGSTLRMRSAGYSSRQMGHSWVAARVAMPSRRFPVAHEGAQKKTAGPADVGGGGGETTGITRSRASWRRGRAGSSWATCPASSCASRWPRASGWTSFGLGLEGDAFAALGVGDPAFGSCH